MAVKLERLSSIKTGILNVIAIMIEDYEGTSLQES